MRVNKSGIRRCHRILCLHCWAAAYRAMGPPVAAEEQQAAATSRPQLRSTPLPLPSLLP